MFKSIYLSYLPVVIASIVLCGCRQEKQEIVAIRRVIQAYNKGGDTQNIKLAKRSLYPDSQHYYVDDRTGKLIVLSTRKYWQWLERKEIGGLARKLVIHTIDVMDNLALARVTMENQQKRGDNYLALMKINSQWKIMNNILEVKLK